MSTKRSSIILAIDTGSSSTRCTAYELRHEDESDEVSSPINAIGIHHSIPLSCIIPSTGHIRIHDILVSIDRSIDNVLSSLRNALTNYQVVAIGFSTFVMNLVGVDEMGEPVDEMATCSYACNRKDAVDECQTYLKQLISSEEMQSLYQQTGAPIHSAYALPQLLTFYKNETNKFASKVRKWQSISSICLHRWMGGGEINIPISYSEASWTGMLDFTACEWNETILKILDSCEGISSLGGIKNLLPALADFDGDSTQGSIFSLLSNGIPSRCRNGKSNPYWERWPELRGIESTGSFSSDELLAQHCRLFLGIGDGAAANCGSKCDAYSACEHGSHRIAVTIGTSAAARVCLPLEKLPSDSATIVPRGLFCYRVDKSRILVGGALTDGGSAIEWARKLLNLHSVDAFDAALEEVSNQYCKSFGKLSLEHPSSQSIDASVTMVPFLSGERSTGFRGAATGCISGITRDTTPIDILFGCLEGVTLRLCAVIGLIEEVCRNQRQHKTSDGSEKASQTILVVSGNALEKNSLWRQMISDCSSLSVAIDGESNEGTSRGVAMLISRRMKHTDQTAEILSIARISHSDEEAKSRWVRARLTQDELINAVSNTWGH